MFVKETGETYAYLSMISHTFIHVVSVMKFELSEHMIKAHYYYVGQKGSQNARFVHPL